MNDYAYALDRFIATWRVVRWTCACGTKNVTIIAPVPETLPCAGCGRRTNWKDVRR